MKKCNGTASPFPLFRLRPIAQVLILSAILSSALALPLAAQNRGADSISHRTLSNGLEIFGVENHSVPLVTICVVFRGGASAQSTATAGLFHLYEHMLFAGNAKFPTKEGFNAALNAMGTTTWNGATGTEFINYHITVPSDKLADGIAFWAAAVRSPVFDPKVLENEKQVVLSEVRGYQSDPNRVAVNALESRMFPDYPWRKNVDGPTSNIEGATVESLRAIQSLFYIPRNMALMIGGDIDPAEVFALAERSFGDWEGGPAPVIGEPPHGALPPAVRVIATDDLYYRGLAQTQFRWRGPDVLRQTRDTYVSDILLFLLSSPAGNLKKNLMDRVPGLYDPEYIDFSYPTARDGGNYIFNTYITVQNPKAEGAILDRVADLEEIVLDEFARIAADPKGYFGQDELEKAKTKLIDQNLYAMESAEDFLTDTLTFWWSTATAQYFFGYEENCRQVSWADISRLLSDYLLGGGGKPAPSAAILVRLRTSTAGSDLRMADKIQELGYVKATADNAFWWQR
jgi:zinc protease